MRKQKGLAWILAVLMVCVLGGVGLAEETDAFLAELEGTYDELFTVVCAPEYDDLWLEYATTYGDAENAEAYAAMLKAACTGTIYGEEAIAAYGADPESAQFDCYFTGGVRQFVFAGNQITGLAEDGSEVFSHTYSYVEDIQGKYTDDVAMDFRLYKTDDADAGQFTYFAMAGDTPGETYHIEFRYGDDLDALKQLVEGEYAYWLAAGIRVETVEEDAPKGIELFVEENLAGEEAA